MSAKVKDTQLYDALGVAPNATQQEIEAAYKTKIQQVSCPPLPPLVP